MQLWGEEEKTGLTGFRRCRKGPNIFEIQPGFSPLANLLPAQGRGSWIIFFISQFTPSLTSSPPRKEICKKGKGDERCSGLTDRQNYVQQALSTHGERFQPLPLRIQNSTDNNIRNGEAGMAPPLLTRGLQPALRRLRAASQVQQEHLQKVTGSLRHKPKSLPVTSRRLATPQHVSLSIHGY